MPVGLRYGYSRVSRGDSQTLDRQISELSAAGCSRVFTDEISGATPTSQRPGFRDLVSHLRPGDRVEVVSLDRLSRSLVDAMTTLDELVEKRGVTVEVRGLGVFDAASPSSRVLFQILSVVNEFQLSLIRSATLSGIAEARRKGVRIGRPPGLDAKGIRTAAAMREGGSSVAEIGATLGLSERTIRRALAAERSSFPKPG